MGARGREAHLLFHALVGVDVLIRSHGAIPVGIVAEDLILEPLEHHAGSLVVDKSQELAGDGVGVEGGAGGKIGLVHARGNPGRGSQAHIDVAVFDAPGAHGGAEDISRPHDHRHPGRQAEGGGRLVGHMADDLVGVGNGGKLVPVNPQAGEDLLRPIHGGDVQRAGARSVGKVGVDRAGEHVGE